MPKFHFQQVSEVRTPAPNSASRWAPAMDVVETAAAYVVRIEVAGIDKDELKLGFGDNTLTVRGERRRDDPGANLSFLRMEIEYGEFHREVEFPKPVDRGAVRAHYQNGFLKVVLPKHESTT